VLPRQVMVYSALAARRPHLRHQPADPHADAAAHRHALTITAICFPLLLAICCS
jgi:hypothetical protein